MQPIEQKILSTIYGRGKGWAFTKIDFVAEFGEANIHQPRSPDRALAQSGVATLAARASVACSRVLDFASLHPDYIYFSAIQQGSVRNYEPMTRLVAEALEV